MTDQNSKKPDPLVQLRSVEELEEIKSEFYELRKGKVWFSKEMQREHSKLKTSLLRYVLHSRFLAILTAPFIYACIVPFALLDLFVSAYQAVCFPVYGIPYGDASAYRERIDKVRDDFKDLKGRK